MVGHRDQKAELHRRLRRIEGQVRGIQQMVAADRYCIDVIAQVSAVTKALQSVAIELVDQHLGRCVRDAIDHGDDADAKIAEATAAIARLVRS